MSKHTPGPWTIINKTGGGAAVYRDKQAIANGKRTEQSVSSDTVCLECIDCRASQWVERKNVARSGRYLALKEGGGNR